MTELLEINVYIASLSHYNAGSLRGEWVTLPIVEEELELRVREILNGMGEEIAIHDFEAPFSISEYSDPFKLNEFMEELQRLQNRNHVENSVLEVLFESMDSKEEVLSVLEQESFRVYDDCDSMRDVAESYLEEGGSLDSIPDEYRQYFDFEAYGRDMEHNGHFYRGSGFYVEVFK